MTPIPSICDAKRRRKGGDERASRAVVIIVIVIAVLILANASGLTPDEALTIISFEPDDTNPSIEEGKSMRFSVDVSAPNETTPTCRWTLDGKMVSTSNFWVYSPDFTESGVKIVELIVSAGDLTESQEWFVSVIDVNQPPKIDYHTPKNFTLSIKEGGIFYVLRPGFRP